jgi:hypothetical protein
VGRVLAETDALSERAALRTVARNTSRNNAQVLTGTERYAQVLDPNVATLWPAGSLRPYKAKVGVRVPQRPPEKYWFAGMRLTVLAPIRVP